MRRVLLAAVALLTLLIVVVVARVAASVFSIPRPLSWVADGTDLHGDPLPEGAVARLGTVRFRSTTLTNLCWLDDGRIATGGFDDEIVFWDGETGERLQVLDGHRGVIPEPLRRWSWRETRDAVLRGRPPVDHDYLRHGHIEQVGDHLISAGASVREWDLRTGAGRVLTRARGGNIAHFDVLEDGNVIRYTIGTREYRLDRTTGRQEKRRLEEDDTLGAGSFTTPNGRWRVSPSRGQLTLRGTADGSVREIPGPRPDAGVRGNALSPDGRTFWCIWHGGVAGSGRRSTLTTVDLESATVVAETALDLSHPWWWLACSPDGRTLALSAVGGRTELRDAKTLELIREIDTPRARFVVPEFAPDGERLALRIGFATVVMIDVATGERMSPAVGHEAPVAAALFLDDDRVLTAGEDGMHRAWEARTGKALWERRGTGLEVPAAAPRNDSLSVSTEAGLLWVRTDDGTVVASRDVPDGWRVVGTAPDGTLLLETEHAIAFLGPDDDTPREIVDRGVDSKANEGTRTSQVGWHPPTGRLLVADETRTPIDENSWRSVTVHRMLDARDGAVLWTLEKTLHDPIVSFRGKHLVLASGRHAAVYDGDGKELHRIKLARDDSFVTAVAFSPDGTRIATGDDESGVHVWCLDTATRVKTLRGHGGAIRSLTWSPDGTLLVSTSYDTTALVWDVGR